MIGWQRPCGRDEQARARGGPFPKERSYFARAFALLAAAWLAVPRCELRSKFAPPAISSGTLSRRALECLILACAASNSSAFCLADDRPNLNSRHPLDYCASIDGVGPVTGLSPSAAVAQGCTNFANMETANPLCGCSVQIQRCNAILQIPKSDAGSNPVNIPTDDLFIWTFKPGFGLDSPSTTSYPNTGSCGCTVSPNSSACVVGVWTDAQCYCIAGLDWDSSLHDCLPTKDVFIQPPCDPCIAYPFNSNPPQGNPIFPLVGNKRETVDTGISLGGLPLRFIYDSVRGPWTYSVPGLDPYPNEYMPEGALGPLWFSSVHRQVGINNWRSLQASRGDGRLVSFNVDSSGAWAAAADQSDSLWISLWPVYKDQAGLALETYTGSVLTSWSSATGMTLTLTYSTSSTSTSVAPSPGYLLSIADPFGRSVGFTYATLPSGSGALSTITDPNNRIIAASYDSAGNLAALTWQDSSIKRFVYDSPNPNQTWALTGVVDESAVRYASFGYSPAGWAQSTQLAGGADSFVVNYATPPQPTTTVWTDSINRVIWRYHEWAVPRGTQITQPNGSVLGMSAQAVLVRSEAPSNLGAPRSTGMSEPVGSGSPAGANAIAYDASGLMASEDDFNGLRTCYVNDPTSKFETARVEGLNNTATCNAYTAANVALPVSSRKVSTQWHPDWRLETQRAAPGKLSTWVYNGQPDPFNGGAIAACAPASAVLPDGKPIAVLCKQVEQASTDADGHLGFAAALQAGVANRVWQWSYNQYGQVLTEKDPNGNTATHSYYADTAFSGADPSAVGHTTGDLQTLTDAKGQITQYTQYNKAGQVLASTDANGVITNSTYDARQRLTTTSVGGQTTRYAYWPTGLLKQVTQPDASYVAYGYDAAHRLTDVSDNLGNSVHYTLDALGNRTAESVNDPQHTLRRSLGRSIDALGRIQQTTGRE